MSPSSSLLLLAKTITHPAARSFCVSWASCNFCDKRSAMLNTGLYNISVRYLGRRARMPNKCPIRQTPMNCNVSSIKGGSEIWLFCNHRVATVGLLRLAVTHINCSSTTVVLMCENMFLVNVLSEFGTVYRQALLVLNHYCRSKILWVMPTSLYTPNTDCCFFIIVVFSFYVTPIFVYITFICMSLVTVWHVGLSGATRPLSRWF